MPGLSRYHASEEPYLLGRPRDLGEPVPEEDYEGDMEVPPELLARMRERLQEYQGFADSTRSVPDEMWHGMADALPPDELDSKIQMIDQDGRASRPYTFRQLIEALQGMSPQRSQESP